jgi:hypothetical protein
MMAVVVVVVVVVAAAKRMSFVPPYGVSDFSG